MRKYSVILFSILITLLMPASVFAAERVPKLTSTPATSEGIYYLIPYNATDKCLSVRGATRAAGASMVINTRKDSLENIWYIEPSVGGTYQMINYWSGLVAGAKNNTTKPGGLIRQNHNYRYNGQRWYLINKGNYYVIQSSISRLVMTVKDNKTNSNREVVLQKYNKKTGQKWKLVKYKKTEGTAKQITSADKTSAAAKTTVVSTAKAAAVAKTTTSKSATKYKTTKRTGMTSADYAVFNNIIGAVETGGQVYGVRDYSHYTAPYTNSNIEHTCTIGWGSFYGEEAQLLIKTIKARAPKTFASIDTKGIIAKKLEVNWVATRWKPNSTEIALLKKLISTSVGKQVQDELFSKVTKVYVSKCTAAYTNNTYALMMYGQIAHLGGTNAANRIFSRCNKDYTLDSIIASLRQEYDTDNMVGSHKYWSRHMKFVEYIEKYAD